MSVYVNANTQVQEHNQFWVATEFSMETKRNVDGCRGKHYTPTRDRKELKSSQNEPGLENRFDK